MHYLQSVLVLVVSCGLVSAWYNRLDNAVYGGGWAPDRRSLSMTAVCTSLEQGNSLYRNYECFLYTS